MVFPPRKIRQLPPAIPAKDSDVFPISQMGEDNVPVTRAMTRGQNNAEMIEVINAARQDLVNAASAEHAAINARIDNIQLLKGDTGNAGATGQTGATGNVGAKGDNGQSGPAGSIGPQGATGSTGATGSAGATGPQGNTGASGATLLGTITVSETAVMAITAGARRVTISTPSGWGVATGQNLIAFPLSVPSGLYAVHDVIPTATNTISVAVSAPLLMANASYSIQCRLVRINT